MCCSLTPYHLLLGLLALLYLTLSLFCILAAVLLLLTTPPARQPVPKALLQPQRDLLHPKAQIQNLPITPSDLPILSLPRKDLSPQAMVGGLVAVATYQGSKAHNQDCFWYESFGPCTALLVADGVSSSTFAEIAARQIQSSLRHAIKQAAAHPPLNLSPDFFQNACQAAVQAIAREVPPDASADSTFIALVELPDRFVVAHLGDGGIVHTRGNRRDGKSILLAHHDEYGRLSGYVGAQGIAGRTPRVIEFNKADFADGEILLIGTDGALPQRQELRHAFALLEELFQQGKAWQDHFTSAQVAQHITQYLQRANPDDNATLGVLFSQQALAYWQQQWQTSSSHSQGENHANLNDSLHAQARQPHAIGYQPLTALGVG